MIDLSGMGTSQDIPRSKIEAINLLRSGEGESESKESVEARNEGQETLHSDQRRREGLRNVGTKKGVPHRGFLLSSQKQSVGAGTCREALRSQIILASHDEY